jgi:hypothetical protein
MCTCASCEYTDSFSGFGLNAAKGGFKNWPRGEPAGQRSSESAYRTHVAHSWAGVSKTVQFTPGQAPHFRTFGIASPLPQPTALVRDWISRSYAGADGSNVFPGPDVKPFRIPTRRPRLIELARELRRAA